MPRFEISYSETAVARLEVVRAYDRKAIMKSIKETLTVNPALESKTGIKKLRQPAPTQYRLRVGDFRIFYDIEGSVVSIIEILTKEQAIQFCETNQ